MSDEQEPVKPTSVRWRRHLVIAFAVLFGALVLTGGWELEDSTWYYTSRRDLHFSTDTASEKSISISVSLRPTFSGVTIPMLITTSYAHSPYHVEIQSSQLDPPYTQLRIDSVVIEYGDGTTEQVASSSTRWMSYANQPRHISDRRFGRQYHPSFPFYYVFPEKLSLNPDRHRSCEVVVNGMISNAEGVQFRFTIRQRFTRHRYKYNRPYWHGIFESV